MFYHINRLSSAICLAIGSKLDHESTIMYPHYCVLFWLQSHIFRQIQKHIFPYGYNKPDNKFHGANRGPIWGREDPGGPHAATMNFVIWECNVPHGWFYFPFTNKTVKVPLILNHLYWCLFPQMNNDNFKHKFSHLLWKGATVILIALNLTIWLGDNL